ncbi:MAG: proline dehydrogenase [Bryobacteraceae bacterium]|jgi:proline dehydrogenase
MIAAPWLPLLRKAARSYVAGPELPDVLRLARTFAARGVPASTLCFWDAQDDAPRHVADMYLATVQAIQSAHLDSYVSIKAPSLAFDAGLVVEIADAARDAGIRMHFDSLGAETVDRTFRLIDVARGRGAKLGCTIPGRWRRSPGDAEKAAQMGLRVRVVKGQWPDPDAAVDPHVGFLDAIGALAGGASPVAVATHDPILAAAAIRKLQSAGTTCEMELLYGLPGRAVLHAVRDLAVPVRYYLPYGHAWLPYALRQARRDPRILWWVLRDASRSQLPISLSY